MPIVVAIGYEKKFDVFLVFIVVVEQTNEIIIKCNLKL